MVNYVWRKSAPPEKILAKRMRKGPPPNVGMGVWGPRMVNPTVDRLQTVQTLHQFLRTHAP